MVKTKKLYKSKKNRVIGGVCAGIGEYSDVDPSIIRLIFVAATIFTLFWSGILLYLIAWAVLPEK